MKVKSPDQVADGRKISMNEEKIRGIYCERFDHIQPPDELKTKLLQLAAQSERGTACADPGA